MTTKRWNKLLQMGYSLTDSGYAENKTIYNAIKAEQETKGNKILRIRTDTKGLISYLIFSKKED